MARPSSSRLTVREAATTARSSRSRYSLPDACATEARSFQSAKRTTGNSSSAMARSASAATGGLPAALLEVFCASMACRTACRPPRKSCSATGICSGRKAASMALRCTVDVGATGRSPRAGRPSPSPGRRAPGRRGPPRAARRSIAAALVRGAPSPSGPPAIPAATVPALAVVVAITASLVRARSQDDRDVRRPPRRALDLNTTFRLLGRASRLRRGEREDLDALEADFDIGPQHRTDGLVRAAREQPRRCPWAGARRRRARSMTRRPSGSSIRCRSGVTCGGHATSPGAPPRCQAAIGIP